MRLFIYLIKMHVNINILLVVIVVVVVVAIIIILIKFSALFALFSNLKIQNVKLLKEKKNN